MALLFSNPIVTTQTPTALEMPNKYAFNGHLYNKTNLNPVPLKFFTGIQTNLNYPIFKRTVSSHNSWAYSKQRNNMEVDVDDSNTFYLIVNDMPAQSLNKITLNADLSYNIASCNLMSGDGNARLDIVDQDSLYIYILKNTNSAQCQVFKVNKSTMVTTIATSFFSSGYKAKLLTKDANTLYFCVVSSASGVTTHIYRVNKSDLTLTDMLTFTKDYTLQAFPTDKVLYEGDASTSIFYMFNVVSTVAEIRKISLDMTLSTITSNSVRCYELVGGVEKDITIPNSFDVYDCVGTFNLQANGNKYIAVFYSCNCINYPSRPTWFLVFKMMGDGRLKLIQRQNYPFAIQGLLEFNNNLNLALLGRTFVKSLSWDVNSEKFILSNELNGMFLLIGADENGNLWSFSDTKAINIHSQYSPSTINAEFELENYDFKGPPIGSYVYFYAKNFYGQYVTCSAELTLEGPCKFTDNNSQTLIKTTSSTGKVAIPIEVNDDGVLRVGVRLLQS